MKDSEQVFYKLKELSEKLEVESSVLRFWEKEFTQIKPLEAGPRKRLYRHQDLEIFAEIKRLLYEERYTIAGAKKRLKINLQRSGAVKDEAQSLPPQAESDEAEELRKTRAQLEEARQGLRMIKALLATGRNGSPAGPAAASHRPSPIKKKSPNNKTQDSIDDSK